MNGLKRFFIIAINYNPIIKFTIGNGKSAHSM